MRSTGTIRLAGGRSARYHKVGYHPYFGRMICIEDAPMEIAAFKEVKERFKIVLDSFQDVFYLLDKETDDLRFQAKAKNGVYPIQEIPRGDYVVSAVMDTTPPMDKILMSLHKRLLHCSVGVMKESIAKGHYRDVLPKDVSEKDLNWSVVEECVTCKLCKDGRLKDQERGPDYNPKRRRKHYETEETPMESEEPLTFGKQQDVKVAFDIVYVAGYLCVCMIVKPFNYVLCEWVSKKDSYTLYFAVTLMLKKVKAAPGVRRIVSVSVDRERGINAVWENELLLNFGIRMERPVPYRHESRIERFVRTARNRYRCIVRDARIPLSPRLKRMAWEHVFGASNFVMNVKDQDYLPVQYMYKSKEYRTPPAFGTMVYVGNPIVKDKDTDRKQVGMIVGFEETTRAVKMKFSGNDEILIRDAYSPVADQMEGLDLFFESDENDNDLDYAWSEPREDQIELMDKYEMEELCLDERNDGAIQATMQDMEDKESIYARHAIDVICGLVEDAQVQGEVGQRAAIKIELERVWKKYGAIKPVKANEVNAKELIKGKLFVTEKRDAEHKFTRNKARFVARGDLRKDAPGNVFSPTVSFPTVMTVLNIILHKQYDFMSVDVESAYLNSDFTGGVFMKLDRNVASIMCDMDKAVKEFVNPDGTIFVKIVKALYGLQESAKLWYETLSATLKQIGFQRSNYDHALYYKKVRDELVMILVYVDDMMIAGKRDAIREVKQQLEKSYVLSCSEVSPKVVDYVGMRIEFDKDSWTFRLSQPGMVEKVIKGTDRESDVPCDNNLYRDINPESYPDVTGYRSKVMEIAYLSKTRPDLKVALGYLSTKMQNPTIGDYKKLLRLLGYIRKSKDLKMRLTRVEKFQVFASADASFGPFADGKSNTGMALWIGCSNAPVLAKSSKQKSVANSSTAAELIAFSSTLEEVLWITNLLNEIGLQQGVVEIEQDNSSTMRLIQKVQHRAEGQSGLTSSISG